MKPRWMRRHLACPNCGHIIPDSDTWAKLHNQNPHAFDCPRCHEHWVDEDFWNEHNEKWSNEYVPQP